MDRTTPPARVGTQGWISLAAVVVSLAAVLTSVYVSNRQLRESQEQFQATISEGRYASIVDGLTSDSVAVRAGAIGRLYQYATSTQATPEAQLSAAADAIELLALLIQEESGDRPRTGLAAYHEFPSPLIPRAMGRVASLIQWSGQSTVSVDVNRSDFHGLRLSDATGYWNAAGSDFRGSSLTRWRVRGGSFSAAFFTCADLRASDFGAADVSAADFTGADLRGADLAEVTGLTSEQLVGAAVGPTTRLPPGVQAPQVEGNRLSPGDCSTLLTAMTGLPLGYGYTENNPCPAPSGGSPAGPVCQIRARGS